MAKRKVQATCCESCNKLMGIQTENWQGDENFKPKEMDREI